MSFKSNDEIAKIFDVKLQESGFKRKQIADITGVAESSLSHWLSGQCLSKHLQFISTCLVLNIGIKSLLHKDLINLDPSNESQIQDFLKCRDRFEMSQLEKSRNDRLKQDSSKPSRKNQAKKDPSKAIPLKSLMKVMGTIDPANPPESNVKEIFTQVEITDATAIDNSIEY